MTETKPHPEWVAGIVLQTLRQAPGLSPRDIRIALSRGWNSGRARQKTGGRRGKVWEPEAP